MPVIRKAFLLEVSVWLFLVLAATAAVARIRRPQIDELVHGADLIVIGQVVSVRATPQAAPQAGTIILLTASAAILTILLWKRKVAIAACLGAACLLAVLLFDVPYGMYRRMAEVSVSSTIKGHRPAANILIYYDDGNLCDNTHFDVQQKCVLFLKQLPSHYATSWCDWSVWIIKDGYAQAEHKTLRNAAPIAVDEFVSRIKKLSDGAGPVAP